MVTKSCGVDLYPGKLDQNDYCILCSGCLKTCYKYKQQQAEGRPNPGFRFVGFARDLFSIRPLKDAEAFFLILVSGFMIISRVNRALFIGGVYQKLYYLIPLFYGSIFLFTIFLWRWIYLSAVINS